MFSTPSSACSWEGMLHVTKRAAMFAVFAATPIETMDSAIRGDCIFSNYRREV